MKKDGRGKREVEYKILKWMLEEERGKRERGGILEIG